ncbi:MAG TPA: protein kinase [Planctomycetota bacterium]|nr:protein kinase [Planctomycetota bacterium]
METPARRVGDWELLRELGRGSNGVVYAVTKAGLGRELALKVLLTPTTDEAVLARFELEARITGKLDDPGVVAIHEFGRDARGRPYFVMELCRGKDLRQMLAGGPLPVMQALEIAAELARVLSLAHGKGVIHRDLKPANIMMDAETGRPRLMDFGLARDHSIAVLTRSGDVLGTPIYMAPEQLKGSKGIDHRVDLYGLGAVLYQCLTGRPPHVAASIPELARKVGATPPQRPSALRPEVPSRVDEICLRALAKDARDRYPDAEEMRRELLEAIVALAPRGKKRSRLPLALAIGGIVALLAGVGAFALTRESRAAPPPAPPPTPARTPPAPPPPKRLSPEDVLRSDLGRALDGAKDATPSLVVCDQTLRPLFERRPNEPRPLGDCMDLVTAAAAVCRGRGSFVTTIKVPRPADNGSVGALVVIGDGDPSIDDDAVRKWAKAIHDEGITRIESDLIVDARRFDISAEQRLEPREPADATDGPEPHRIWMSALAVHDGCVNVHGAENPPRIEPRLANTEIVEARGAELSQMRHDPVAGRWTLELASHLRATIVVPVEDPELYLGEFLKEELLKAGVEVRGDVRRARLESFADWTSLESCRRERELGWVLWYVIHDAKAWYAQCVFRDLGCGGDDGAPSTWKTARRNMATFLEGCGASAGEFDIVDGSGWAPGTKMSPRALVLVLGRVLNDERTRGAFEDALAQIPKEAKAQALGPKLRAFDDLGGPWGTDGVRYLGIGGLHPGDGIAGEVRKDNGRRVVFALLGAPTKLQHSVLAILGDYVHADR